MKLTNKYIHREKEIDINCIRISSTGNGSISAAQNISYLFQMYYTPTKFFFLDNQGTDAGGGVTQAYLGKRLDEENRVRDFSEYNISTCTLRGINMKFSSATELSMGTGGLKKRTALQCLHST